ncbi:MAG: hypothetical protein IKI76_03075 [Selenomonadaceae bacterium]|nr:hypothetical protein [Selenomonadaceae bacterium]
MSLFYLKALQGEEPYASWYGLSKPVNIEVTITITDDEEEEPATCLHASLENCSKCKKLGKKSCPYT